MVQFNLLPDVKLQYIKSRRTQHLVTFIATITGAAAVGVLVMSMFVVYFAQKQHIAALSKDIKKYTTEIKNVDDIERMLTVQNQLNTLTSLHENKPVTSRLFGYIQQTTPQQISLSKLSHDYTSSTITLGGTAESLDSVKVYANALKAAGYSVDGGSVVRAFSDVVLTSFSRNDKGASFIISAKFDPALFDVKQNVTLQVLTMQSNLQGSPFEGGQ